jgi:hypothetical protein
LVNFEKSKLFKKIVKSSLKKLFYGLKTENTKILSSSRKKELNFNKVG